MKKAEISLKYKIDSDSKLAEQMKLVAEGMKDNLFFEELNPLITQFIIDSELFINSIPSPTSRSQILVAEKDAAKEKALTTMNKLAAGVNYVAFDNLLEMEKTNFPLKNKPTPKPTPPVPENVQIFASVTPNCLVVKCDSNKGARLYEAWLSEDRINWIWKNSETSSSVKIGGLPAGVILFAKMRMRNGKKIGPWSNSVEVRVSMPNEPILKMNK